MQTKTISLRVSLDFDRRVRIEAAKRDLDRSTYIRRTLTEKLAEIERQQQTQPPNDRRGLSGRLAQAQGVQHGSN